MKIKYLYNSFSKANKQKVLTPYLFYLQLKSISPQGEFLKGEVIKTIQSHLDYSAASISTQLKKCIKLGYISLYKHESNKEWKYCLSSYKNVWNKLKFRFKTDYVERFKFELIDLSVVKDKKSLKAFIFYLELKRNKAKQTHVDAVNKIERADRMIRYHEQTISTTKSEKIKEKKKAALIRLNLVKQSLKELPVEGSERPIENKISCKKAAELIGYKTAMTTVNLSKKATQMQLFIKKSVKTLVATGISRIEFSINPSFANCMWIFGKVYKQECSIFSFR